MAMNPNDRPKKKTLTPMQGLVGLIRESLPLLPPCRDDGEGGGGGFGGLVGKVRSILRNSRIGLISKSLVRALPPVAYREDAPPIRWHKGKLIGSGALGRVYMGMNIDSGELFAVKQVLIAERGMGEEIVVRGEISTWDRLVRILERKKGMGEEIADCRLPTEKGKR